jgi:MinD-like ATPase involved in chromosome partitioning or flagellar assembly
VDLPTYTNIWRIEKRLYKLYDLRLPMPLPLGQIVAFVGITVPYIILLTLIGIPFNHNLFWLYVLPPWAITWLATRPVLENKRLSELLVSQIRYLGEPKVWCRMAPAAEKDEITVTGRVWHARRQAALQPAVSRVGSPAQFQTTTVAQPKWAPAPGASRRRTEPRHRRAAAPQQQPLAAANGQLAAGNGQLPVANGRLPGGNGQAQVRGVAAGPAIAPGQGQVRNVPGVPVVAPGVAQWARRGPAPALDSRAIAHEARPRDRAAAARAARMPATAGPPPAPGTPARASASAAAGPPPVAAGQATAGPVTAGPVTAGPVTAGPATAGPATAGPATARPATAGPASTRPQRRPARPAAPAAGGSARPDWATRARPGPNGGWPVGPRSLEVAHAENGRPVKKSAPRPSWEPKQPPASPPPAAPPTASAAPPAPTATPPAAPPTAPLAPAAPPAAPVTHAPPAGAHAGPVVRPYVPAVPNGGVPAPVVTPKYADVPARPAAFAGPGATFAGPGTTQEERDQARARLPLPGPRRIVVLGCTSGAGQTVTALLTARMLASLRREPVGALDLNPGDGSLAQRSQAEPAGTVHELLAAGLPARPAPGVEVISGAANGTPSSGDHDFAKIGEQLAARYGISLVDPGAAGVSKALAIADQLVLVAPASGDAPRAVAMTRDWLERHDHHELAANAVMVVNGVSTRSLSDVEQAEAIMVGRCRAIVRVPWEDQVSSGGGPCAGTAPLRQSARQAITELAGVLVSGHAAGPGDQR